MQCVPDGRASNPQVQSPTQPAPAGVSSHSDGTTGHICGPDGHCHASHQIHLQTPGVANGVACWCPSRTRPSQHLRPQAPTGREGKGRGEGQGHGEFVRGVAWLHFIPSPAHSLPHLAPSLRQLHSDWCWVVFVGWAQQNDDVSLTSAPSSLSSVLTTVASVSSSSRLFRPYPLEATCLYLSFLFAFAASSSCETSERGVSNQRSGLGWVVGTSCARADIVQIYVPAEPAFCGRPRWREFASEECVGRVTTEDEATRRTTGAHLDRLAIAAIDFNSGAARVVLVVSNDHRLVGVKSGLKIGSKQSPTKHPPIPSPLPHLYQSNSPPAPIHSR